MNKIQSKKNWRTTLVDVLNEVLDEKNISPRISSHYEEKNLFFKTLYRSICLNKDYLGEILPEILHRVLDEHYKFPFLFLSQLTTMFEEKCNEKRFPISNFNLTKYLTPENLDFKNRNKISKKAIGLFMIDNSLEFKTRNPTFDLGKNTGVSKKSVIFYKDSKKVIDYLKEHYDYSKRQFLMSSFPN